MGNLIKNQINKLIALRNCSLLGIGPMSKNCVDATLDISNTNNIPLMLIASRRQIDSEFFGGGYVNNWNTEQFANYVKSRDKNKKVFLARDHGGPWQSDIEKENKLDLRSAMESAKNSYKSDIDAGFKILHIDPSIDIHNKPSLDQVLERVFELYEFCWSYAKKSNKEIVFEIGTEEQSGSSNSQDEVDYSLSKVIEFCKKNEIPKPTFIVVQTGTRVMETRNIGSFDNPLRVKDEIPSEIQIPKIIEICNRHGVFIKEHNADYLSNEALKWHPRLGIHSANIAPEFGVIETRKMLSIFNKNGLQELSNSFLEYSFKSGKWKKWMLQNSQTSDTDKSIICGHYVFSTDYVKNLKNEARKILSKKGIDLDENLKMAVRQGIERILKQFRVL